MPSALSLKADTLKYGWPLRGLPFRFERRAVIVRQIETVIIDAVRDASHQRIVAIARASVTGKPVVARVIPEIAQPLRQQLQPAGETLERKLIQVARDKVMPQIERRKRARAPKLKGLRGSEMLEAWSIDLLKVYPSEKLRFFPECRRLAWKEL